MVFEWQMIMSSLDLAIPLIGWQLRRGVTAQKPITNDDSLKMRHIVHQVCIAGEHIPKYHDINFAICIQPKQAEGGILLLPQHYHKLCAHSFSQYQTDEMKLLYRCTFFCYCLFSIFEWKRLKHKQTCPPLLLPSTLVPFPCCNKSGCKWMGHEEYNSAVQTREQ